MSEETITAVSDPVSSPPDEEDRPNGPKEPLGPIEVPEPGVVDVPERGVEDVPERRL